MTHSILVVDDTDANRYVLVRCLAQAGYAVSEAATGAQALELVGAKPDLVVLDINLPDMDGYDVCRRIKGDPATRNILVLNVSASFITSDSRVHGLENGADSYLVQPLEPTEFLATVRSLLRLRDAERTAMRREARFRALVDASSQAVWALAPDGALIEENGLAALLGTVIDPRRPAGWLDGFIAEDGERLQGLWQKALADSTAWEATVRARTADGGLRHFHVRLVPWRDPSTGRVMEWIGSASEVTGRIEAEERLATKAEELARSNQYLEHFAYVLSHDLQEPLRTITNYLDLLGQRLGESLDEKNARYFSYMSESALRMRQLISGVLQYSTVTRTPTRQRLELASALEEALANLKPPIEAKQAQIHYDPLPFVVADRTQIVQLFQNLLSNALKYCQDRPPEVFITVDTRGGFHHISVRDNGIGMEPHHLEQIFELFRRLHSREQYEGTGIGLALCRRIVEHHGGSIWAESAAGTGSTFSFTLPVGAPAAA